MSRPSGQPQAAPWQCGVALDVKHGVAQVATERGLITLSCAGDVRQSDHVIIPPDGQVARAPDRSAAYWL